MQVEQPLAVQKEPLSQVLTCRQVFVCWLQLSAVHGKVSAHSGSPLHSMHPSCASQRCPMAHLVLSGRCVQPIGPQLSTVHAMLSLHSASSQQTAQPTPAQHFVPFRQPSKAHVPALQVGL